MLEKEPLNKTETLEEASPCQDEEIFEVTEIEIEEVTIDGICGVY